MTPNPETENDRMRKHGIPRWLKRLNKRYGKGSVDGIAAAHLQIEAPVLDHWRDRAAQAGGSRPYPSTKPAALPKRRLRVTVAPEAA